MSESVATGCMPSMALKTDIRLVSLTKSQRANVAEFIEFGLIDHIRNDPDLDNVRWIADMVEAWKTLEKAGGGDGE